MRPLVLLFLFLGFPLLGTWLSGHAILPYLTFPPRPAPIHPEEVSWTLFFCVALGIMLTALPFLLRMGTFSREPSKKISTSAFPFWGWIAIISLAIWWFLAWTRWPFMGEFQLHTFTPLWLSYIALVNALTMMRIGRCLLVSQPKLFLSLFPISAVFWWVFEYLNRFVQNWHYLPATNVTAITYFLIGSVSFSTVLPAVYATHELLGSFPRVTEPFKSWRKIYIQRTRNVGWALLLAAFLGLTGIGLWPDLLYPLIWVSPLLWLVGLQILRKQDNLIEKLGEGDWRPIVTPALAGLICGVFWELWNSQSLAHWEYAIPHLHAFQIFEMPVLGYAGYFFFGMECLGYLQFLLPRLRTQTEKQSLTVVNTIPLKTAYQTPWHHTRNI